MSACVDIPALGTREPNKETLLHLVSRFRVVGTECLDLCNPAPVPKVCRYGPLYRVRV